MIVELITFPLAHFGMAPSFQLCKKIDMNEEKQAGGLQKLELAHVVAARRLQEGGALGDTQDLYVPVRDRVAMMARDVMRDIAAAGGDAETAAVDARSSLGKYLDLLPTAEDAIDYFMSKSAIPIDRNILFVNLLCF